MNLECSETSKMSEEQITIGVRYGGGKMEVNIVMTVGFVQKFCSCNNFKR